MYQHYRLKIALLACMCSSLLGCGGGSSGLADPSDSGLPNIQNSQPVGEVPAPIDHGDNPAPDGALEVETTDPRFQVNEDESLDEQLAVEASQNLHYALHRNAIFGQVELDSAGVFRYTPDADFFGEDNFEFYLRSDTEGSLPMQVTITVVPVADPPIISGDPATTVRQGETYLASFSAVDPDGEELAFVSTNLPSWLTLDERTGVLKGIPGQSDVGMHKVVVSVVDAGGVFAHSDPFTIEVTNVNDPPRIDLSQFPTHLDARQRISVDLAPIDEDGDQVTLSVAQNPHLNAQIENEVLQLSVADVNEVITTVLVLTATDQNGAKDIRKIRLRLYPLSESGRARTFFGRPQGPGLHIVVLGDGYQPNESGLFRDHVNDMIELMQEDPSIETHMSALHIHAISSPSRDSGIDDDYNDDVRDTAFNAGYNCNGIQRLICADELAMFEISLEEFPYMNQLIMLVNDRRFGGSGGSAAIASAYHPEISLHEMGHSIARLGDEYLVADFEMQAGPTFAEGQFPNVSMENNPYDVPWSHWIDDKSNYPTVSGQIGVGVFSGAYYSSSLFRPTSDSRMRSNDRHFGPVNGEQWVLSIYRNVGAVRDFGPVVRELEVNAGDTVRLFVNPMFGDDLQKVEWFLDGQPVPDARQETEFLFTAGATPHRVEVQVSDVSGLVRTQRLNPSFFNWHWEVNVR